MTAPVKYVHNISVHNVKAATHIVPLVIKIFHPGSVIDFGCGLGTWLKVFYDNGIKDYLGVDGDYVNKSLLAISPNNFRSADLSLPFALDRKYDLAISLEVAEHIPKEAEEIFLNSLTELSDNIIFSASIPCQGGQSHTNENWQSYWAELFIERGFFIYDLFRAKFWKNKDVEWWYSQNIFLATKSKLNFHDHISNLNDYVHPCLYLKKLAQINDLLEQNFFFKY